MSTVDIDYTEALLLLKDPIEFYRLCWPDSVLYPKQVDILRSIARNDKTLVHAGNMLGKDYITGFIALWFFCSRSPCRVVTSSSGEKQLESVLWGEMRRLIQTSVFPLPIKYNHMEIKQVMPDGSIEPRSYIKGIVTNEVENLQGHHLERGPRGEPATMAIADEASSIENKYIEAMETWAHVELIIGNPLPCTTFFYTDVKKGNIPYENNADKYHQYVIHIKAEDSPNVQLGMRQKELGQPITDEVLVPGLIGYNTYQSRRKLWDPIRQQVSLDGLFYEGAEALLYPPDWLDRANRIAELGNRKGYRVLAVDSAEGGDNTCFTVADACGIIEQISVKTHDTSTIMDTVVRLKNEYKVEEHDIIFDRGGGGKQHADYLRKFKKVNARTIAFGEPPTTDIDGRRKTPGFIGTEKRRELQETKYEYKNRRAEMYGILRILLNPLNEQGWGIPRHLVELRRQLCMLPTLYDAEGRLYLYSKNKKSKDSQELTLKELLGCSPDEADSTVMAAFALTYRGGKRILGALF